MTSEQTPHPEKKNPPEPGSEPGLADQTAEALTLAPEEVEKDREKLRSKSTLEIRRNNRILIEKKDGESTLEQATNLKLETQRRLSAYTNLHTDSWYTLDYANLGQDIYGKSHEMNVGLGDILLDPDITEVTVKKDGQLIKAHRGITAAGPHRGRIAFLDESNNYVATHTGDQFQITDDKNSKLSSPENLMSYTETLEKEEQQRNPLKNIDTANITPELISSAEQECSTKSETQEDLLTRTSLLALTQHVAKVVKIPSSIILATIQTESKGQFDPNMLGDGGLAKGLGQFHAPAWSEVRSDPRFEAIMVPFSGQSPETIERAESILADITGIAIMLRYGADTFNYSLDENSQPTVEQLKNLRFYYHTPAYARSFAQGRPSTKAQKHFAKNASNYSEFASQTLAYSDLTATLDALA